MLSSTDDILDIPEADLWGWKKNNDDTEDPKNKKEDATESAEEADDESDEEEVREKTGEPTKPDVPESGDESDADKPSDEDLIALFDAIPMEPAEDGWDRNLPVMVVPLSFDDFMECFWAGNAPYFIPAMASKENEEVVKYSLWEDPTEEDKAMFGNEILSIRKIQKKVPVSAMWRMYTAPNVIQQIALMS